MDAVVTSGNPDTTIEFSGLLVRSMLKPIANDGIIAPARKSENLARAAGNSARRSKAAEPAAAADSRSDRTGKQAARDLDSGSSPRSAPAFGPQHIGLGITALLLDDRISRLFSLTAVFSWARES